MESKRELKMIKFPSIEQPRRVFPHLIHSAQFTHIDQKTKKPCYNTSAALPVLEFHGTVKLHGSNAAIVQTFTLVSPGDAGTEAKNIHLQSRERILSAGNDLMGFYAHMSGQKDAIARIFTLILETLSKEQQQRQHIKKGPGPPKPSEVDNIAIFGEWCGIGIQKGVAISKVPKMFVVFAIKVVYRNETSPAEFIDIARLAGVKDEGARIFNVMQFATYSVVIDFNSDQSLEAAKAKMDALTLAVEEECPVGNYFGAVGTGEGIVWRAVQSADLPDFRAGYYLDSRFWFKTKGVKHMFSKKSEAVPKAVVPSAKVKTEMDAFLKLVLTPGRLEQGIQVLERELCLPIEMESLGAFIKWVNGDVEKEEYDRIQGSGIDKETLLGSNAAAAKTWYCNYLKEAKMESLKKTLNPEL